ncbi:MAG: tetratricopeptide repeat protein [bacterium]
MLFLLGGCASAPQQLQLSDTQKMNHIDKADFDDEILVLLLIKEGILVKDPEDKDYIYFNSRIRSDNELNMRLNKIGISMTDLILDIWEEAYTDSQVSPDTAKEMKILLIKGNTYSESGYYKKALALYKEVFERYHSADAAYNIGVTLETNLDRPKEAIPYYIKFIMMEKEGEDVEQVKSWLKALQKQYREKRDLALLLRERSEKKTGIKELLSGRPINDESILSESQKKEVEDLIKEGARAYWKNDFARAAEKYEKVLRFYDSPDACYNLGVIYEKKLQRYEDALFFYNRYLEIEPAGAPSNEVAKSIKRLERQINE